MLHMETRIYPYSAPEFYFNWMKEQEKPQQENIRYQGPENY